MRAWQQAGSGTRTYFLYDGTQPVFEQTAGGSFLAANTFGADGLASRRSSGLGTVCYLFDERGNVAERTDSTGAVTGSEVYDAYGARTGTAAQADPFGYEGQAGYYTDLATGLILCTHRFYDPQAGRFVTRDPIGYEGGVNLYGYTRNNPINGSDPSGFIDWEGTPFAGRFYNDSTVPIVIAFDRQQNGFSGPKKFYYFAIPPGYMTTMKVDVDYVLTGKNQWEHIRGFYYRPANATNKKCGKIGFTFWKPEKPENSPWPYGWFSVGKNPWQPQRITSQQASAQGLIEPIPSLSLGEDDGVAIMRDDPPY